VAKLAGGNAAKRKGHAMVTNPANLGGRMSRKKLLKHAVILAKARARI
jgi:hypothetical protein